MSSNENISNYVANTASTLLEENFKEVYDKVSSSDFEILSTIRYDPNLSECKAADKELMKFSKDLDLSWCPDFQSTEGFPNPFPITPMTTFDGLSSILNGDSNVSTYSVEQLKALYYSRFFLLGEHLRRIQFSLDFFDWDCQIDIKLLLDLLIDALPDSLSSNADLQCKMNALLYKSDCYKMRVLINSTGKIKIEAHLLPSTSTTPTRSDPQDSKTNDYFLRTLLGGFLNGPPTWTVYIYDKPLLPSPFTSFKTTKRDHYNLAREKLQELHKGKSGPAEILLFNSNNELMEGTITNCYVKKQIGENCVYETPGLSSGCLTGVMRYFLISKRVVKEVKNIDINSLQNNDEILLSNGIMGIVKGIIVKD